MGCLLAPLRALGCLVILAVLVAGWFCRDRLRDEFLRLNGARSGAVGPDTGRPGTRALAAAKARTDSVARHKADSVVLSASEMASLIGEGMAPAVRGTLDSLTVRLLDGQIEVGARLSTTQLPRNLLGLLGRAVPDHARISATGPVDVTGSGRGEWEINRMDLGGVPVPVDVMRTMLGRALGDSLRGTLPVAIPKGVREIRVRPTGAVLVGARKP